MLRQCGEQQGSPAFRAPISLLVNVLSSGGAQRRIAALANDFAERGRAVDVVSFDAEGPMRAMLSPAVNVVPLGRATVRALCTYLEGARPVVLMSCVTDTHAVAVAARRSSEARTPLVLRASRHPYRVLPRWDLLRRAGAPLKHWTTARRYARADAIVALSDDAAEALERLLRGRTVPIAVIPNPIVNRTLLDEPKRPRGGEHNEMPLVLGIGRLVKQKDFATLLRAFALVHAERRCRLVLLGEGEERSRLRALAERLGITSDVAMPGEVDNVAEWLDRADLLVSTSLWEGMQAVLIEALAAGCPVVATDCPGGARETLADGRLGPIVPVGNPVAIARAMIAQLDRPPDPMLLASGAERFTSEGKAERYLTLFAGLTEAAAP